MQRQGQHRHDAERTLGQDPHNENHEPNDDAGRDGLVGSTGPEQRGDAESDPDLVVSDGVEPRGRNFTNDVAAPQDGIDGVPRSLMCFFSFPERRWMTLGVPDLRKPSQPLQHTRAIIGRSQEEKAATGGAREVPQFGSRSRPAYSGPIPPCARCVAGCKQEPDRAPDLGTLVAHEPEVIHGSRSERPFGQLSDSMP